MAQMGPSLPWYRHSMASLPSFSLLWAHYPDDQEQDKVKQRIGGNVNLPWLTNTCVVRMSYAFNLSGQPVPNGHAGLTTVSGADGRRYAFRVREFKSYLENEYKAPDITGSSMSAFQNSKGIIMFDVSGWSDATGHFDMWNGSAAKYRDYWEKAHTIHLWVCD
jgi:hypothetical protein